MSSIGMPSHEEPAGGEVDRGAPGRLHEGSELPVARLGRLGAPQRDGQAELESDVVGLRAVVVPILGQYGEGEPHGLSEVPGERQRGVDRPEIAEAPGVDGSGADVEAQLEVAPALDLGLIAEARAAVVEAEAAIGAAGHQGHAGARVPREKGQGAHGVGLPEKRRPLVGGVLLQPVLDRVLDLFECRSGEGL
jgi:hypothetical protein